MKHFSKFFLRQHFFSDSDNSHHCSDNHPLSPQELDDEINTIGNFIRTGLVVMSVMLLSVIAIGYGQKSLTAPRTVTSSSSQNLLHSKKLPIYCVDKKEKKIALSFDAAWGDSCLLKPSLLIHQKHYK